MMDNFLDLVLLSLRGFSTLNNQHLIVSFSQSSSIALITFLIIQAYMTLLPNPHHLRVEPDDIQAQPLPSAQYRLSR